jgi:dipeptidyl aminopeptidase/acylaminoacyl peptidase
MRQQVVAALVAIAFAAGAAATDTTRAPGAAAAQLPLEHFTRHDEFGDVKISPDGEYLSMTAGKYGRSAIAFVRRSDRKVVGGARAPEGQEIDECHWVAPTRVICMIASRMPGVAAPMLTGEIIALNVDGSEHKQIYGYSMGAANAGTIIRGPESSYATSTLVSTLPKDARNVLITEQPWRESGATRRTLSYDPDAQPRITLLDTYSGRKKPLGTAPLSSARVLVDREEQARFAVGWNEQGRLAVSWRPQAEAPWREFELAGFERESIAPLRFAADNRSVYFTGARENQSRVGLHRVVLDTGQVETLSAGTADVVGIVTDLRDEEVIGYATYSDRLARAWLPGNHPDQRFYESVQRAFPGQTVRVTSRTDGGRLVLLHVSSDVNPGEYYLMDAMAMKADFLQASRKWIDPRAMRPKEPFSLKARDGLDLHGYLTRPAGAGPYPLVVLPHGGPHGIRDHWDFDSEVQLLASRGYAVLQVNFRGSGGYGLAFEKAGYREWGARMQDDLTDATRWAIAQGIARPGRICLYGASYGGYAALMGVAREPDLYRCAIGLAGVYDLELLRSSGDIPGSRFGKAYLDKVLGDDAAVLRSRSPTHLAAAIRAPVMLIHGKVDTRADYAHAKAMKDALEQHDKPFEWVALSGEGHGIYDESTRVEVYDRILAFLARHLGQAGEPAPTPQP